MATVTSIRKNQVAGKLELYFKREGLNFFRRRDIHDEADTIIYITALPAGSRRLLAAIITDSSVYTIIRCHLGVRKPGHPDDDAFLAFVGKLNASHAFFKYAVNEDGGLYIDVCIPATPAYFDPEMVRTTMNLLVYHLGEEYPAISKWLDVLGDADQEVNM